MKTTAERLNDVYCRPTNDAEFLALDIDIVANGKNFKDEHEFYKWEIKNTIYDIDWRTHKECLVRINGQLKLFKVEAGKAYCVNSSDWSTNIVYETDNRYPIYEHGENKTEIPTSQFIDLMNDSIVPWRLEQDGFVEVHLPTCIAHEFTKDNGVVIQVTSGGDVSVIERRGWKTDHILMQGIKTYTQIITQNELVG